MAEKQELVKEKADYTGFFNFTGMYSYAYNWLKNDEGYDVTEEKYSEKVSGNKRDITVEWKCSKDMSDYYKIELKIRFVVTGLTEVDVEVDGKKTRTNQGKVEVEIKGTLIVDPDSTWDSSPSYKFFRDIYNKYIIPSRTKDMRSRTFGIVANFKDSLKSYLEISAKR
jgi:hypothetical protein